VMRWYSVSLSILAPLPFFLFPFFSLIILIFQYLRKMGWKNKLIKRYTKPQG
jgi:hypothetical protein